MVAIAPGRPSRVAAKAELLRLLTDVLSDGSNYFDGFRLIREISAAEMHGRIGATLPLLVSRSHRDFMPSVPLQ